jgi:head-tail adaptor
MNVGKFNERVNLLIPQYSVNDYNRNEVNGYIQHERWGQIDRKHSKKFNMRFVNGSTAEGILTIRKESQFLRATRIKIEDTEYDIDSIIPTQNNTYYEIIYKEAVI